MPVSPIVPIYKSIIRAISDMIDELNAMNQFTLIGYHNWEERGPEMSLPKHTLIGVDGFAFDENEGRWIVRFALAVSTFNDANLLNEIELLGAIHERMGERKKIALLDMNTGLVDNELLIAKFDLQPMSQSELRNYRVIGMELLRTGI
jgi:hypothetical protein